MDDTVALGSTCPRRRPLVEAIAAALRKRRVHAASKWTHLFLAPPLCITSDEIEEAMDLIEASIAEASEGL